MADIRTLPSLDAALLRQLISGYTSTEMYAVSRTETPEHVRFELRLIPRDRPIVKRYSPLDQPTLAHYTTLAAQGHCLGAFVGDACAGLALTEPQAWNRSLWVHELHVAASHQRQGIGRQLMDAVIASAHARQLRCVVCETQSSNVPAIRFYRALGFTLEGLDLTYYTNADRERGEVAIFMKRLLAEAEPPPP